MNTIIYIYIDSDGKKHESITKIPEILLSRMGWRLLSTAVQGVLV